RKVQAEKSIMSQTLQRQPSSGEISEKLGISEKKLNDTLMFADRISGFEAQTEQDSFSILDLYEDFTYSPETLFDQTMAGEQTKRLLSVLKERERFVISHRFELGGRKRQSLKRMGSRMGLSPETVRHIEKRALQRLHTEASKGYLYLSA
ncbi:MAG: sigma factor-like helix-turn-helix DNA-binding protein, partial [Spirochaetia bacterium]|nr:sigma factor-like helix-turn-helix DNA-binding protein [Spirochaetia bacterium]